MGLELFQITIIAKALDGLLELIGGALLFLVPHEHLARWMMTLTEHELSRDPHDFIATHILHSAQHLTRATTVFAALYLLSHGFTKIILVIEIFRRHHWAYVGMIIFLVLSVGYQSYRLGYEFSWTLLILTIFDLIVLYLTHREARKKAPHLWI